MESTFKNLSELNFAIRMARIIDDAVETKTGISASDLILSDIMYGRKKKVVFAGLWDDIKTTVGRLRSGGVNSAKILGVLALLYGSYVGGERIINKVREWMGLDPDQKGNTPDPYEHIKEPYKYQDTNIPNRSREVSPGFYEPEASGQPWYQGTEGQKFWDAGSKTGVPAQFGIAPGFTVGGGPSQSNFSDVVNKLRQSNNPITANRKVEAQNFTSHSIDSISDAGKLDPDIQNWVNPTGWEQFLSQGAGKWAAQPEADAAFFDPSGTLGRDKPMEFKPPGAGQDFATIDPMAYKMNRLRAFNKIEPQRKAARSIYLMRLLDLKEKSGAVNPNEAAVLRDEIAKLQQSQAGASYDQILEMINRGMEGGTGMIPGQSEPNRLPTSQIDWNSLSRDPFADPQRRALMQGAQGKVQGLMSEYQKNPLYQNAVEKSPLLSEK